MLTSQPRLAPLHPQSFRCTQCTDFTHTVHCIVPPPPPDRSHRRTRRGVPSECVARPVRPPMDVDAWYARRTTGWDPLSPASGLDDGQGDDGNLARASYLNPP
mgnify:CR=1